MIVRQVVSCSPLRTENRSINSTDDVNICYLFIQSDSFGVVTGHQVEGRAAAFADSANKLLCLLSGGTICQDERWAEKAPATASCPRNKYCLGKNSKIYT